jgi:hypothetical protein
MKRILRQSDERALGGGNPTTQWRRRKKDPEYAAIWFNLNGRPACFADERDAYWEKQRTKGFARDITSEIDATPNRQTKSRGENT